MKTSEKAQMLAIGADPFENFEVYTQIPSMNSIEVIPNDDYCRSENEYDRLTQEEMYFGLIDGVLPEKVFEILFWRLRRLVIYMAYNYMRPLSMTEDDMCQEAMILLWEIIMKRSYKAGLGKKFSSFYFKCWEYRLNRMWRDFVSRNPVPINCELNWYYEPLQGNSVMQWSESADKYRVKRKIWNDRWLQKKAEQGKIKEAA